MSLLLFIIVISDVIGVLMFFGKYFFVEMALLLVWPVSAKNAVRHVYNLRGFKDGITKWRCKERCGGYIYTEANNSKAREKVHTRSINTGEAEALLIIKQFKLSGTIEHVKFSDFYVDSLKDWVVFVV